MRWVYTSYGYRRGNYCGLWSGSACILIGGVVSPLSILPMQIKWWILDTDLEPVRLFSVDVSEMAKKKQIQGFF